MKAQFKDDFEIWTASLSPGWASMTALFPKSEFRPGLHVGATELVDQFLELHPQQRGYCPDLLQLCQRSATQWRIRGESRIMEPSP